MRGLDLFSQHRRLPLRALADGTAHESPATQVATFHLQPVAGFDTITAPLDRIMNVRYLHRIRVVVRGYELFVPLRCGGKQ